MSVSVDYLIPRLRLRIGDIDSSSYRYLDEWLIISLVSSIRGLERYWGSKYIITEGGYVSRNANYLDFEFPESSGVIQKKDEEIIIIKAALIILEGSLENSAWNLGSWRDSEIYYSNTESARARGNTISKLQAELDSLIKPPIKRLVIGHRATILEEV